MKIALAQIAPVWLNRAATTKKVIQHLTEGAAAGGKVSGLSVRL